MSDENKENTGNVVVIDVENAGDSRAFKNGFHQKAMKRFEDMLDLGKKGESGQAQTADSHTHQAIAVLGERGAGKTSFILQAIDEVKDNCLVVGPIDPTILEHGEQLLPHVLAAMLECDEKIRKKIEDDPQGDLARAYMKCVRRLRALSDKWQEAVGQDLMSDPESFGYELLDEMISARSLRASFREFCQKALDATKKERMLVIIDDVDVAFERGWPVLETVRKYFDFPEITPVILGDFSLYLLLVKDQHYSKLAKIHKHEKEREDVEKSVRQLTNQYLLKVLPAHRRIKLECKSPYEDGAPEYRMNEIDGPRFKDRFAEFLGKAICWKDTRPFEFLPPANTRRLSLFARTMHELTKAHKDNSNKSNNSNVQRRDALRHLSIVYQDLLALYGLTEDDVLRISEQPVVELARLLPRLHYKLPEFWRLEGKRPNNEDHVKLILRLAVDVALANENNPKKKAGMALGLLLVMGWLGQAYDEYLQLSGLEPDHFARYLGLQEGMSSISLNWLAMGLVAIDASADSKVKNRSRSHLYFTTNTIFQSKLENPNVGLFYLGVSKSGVFNYHLFSPLVGLARLADAALFGTEEYEFSVRRLLPTARANAVEEAESQEEDRRASKVQMRLDLFDTLDQSEESVDVREYLAISNSAYHLYQRFSSWVGNRRLGLSELSAWAFIEAFFERFVPDAPEEKRKSMLLLDGLASHIKKGLEEGKDDLEALIPVPVSDSVKKARKKRDRVENGDKTG